MDIKLVRRASTFQQLDGVMTGHQLLCSDPVTFHVSPLCFGTFDLLSSVGGATTSFGGVVFFILFLRAAAFLPLLGWGRVHPLPYWVVFSFPSFE